MARSPTTRAVAVLISRRTILAASSLPALGRPRPYTARGSSRGDARQDRRSDQFVEDPPCSPADSR